jgi:hypothetical protein
MSEFEFAEVARMLAKDKSPEWLPMLAFWSRFVGYRRKPTKYDDDDNKKMIKAAHYLEDELAIYAHLRNGSASNARGSRHRIPRLA